MMAATAITLLRVSEAGYSGAESLLVPLLPAANTQRTFFFCAYSTSSARALDFEDEPNEPLTILAPSLIAYSSPAAAADDDPLPWEFMNFTGMTEAFQHRPDTPVSLLPCPAMIPDT